MPQQQLKPTDIKERYEEVLLNAAKTLKHCQQEKGLGSCLACSQLIGCPVRNSYVEAVYASMNLGQGGGFEF